MKRAVIGLALLTLGACTANDVAIFRTIDLAESDRAPGKQTTALIDAKQRAILVAPGIPTKIPAAGDTREQVSPKRARDLLVCAEPSPDALSAISTALSISGGFANASGTEVQVALANSLKEVASSIGKRNATVTLLRDGLYHQCEAYLNGLIDEVTYDQIANKYVNAMVVLLAVEELAGRGAQEVQTVEGSGEVNATTNVTVNPPAPPAEDEGESEDGAAKSTDDAAATPSGDATDAGTSGTQPTDAEGGGDDGGSSSSEAEANAGQPAVGVVVNSGGGDEIPSHVSAAVQAMVLEFQRKDTKDYCLIQMRRLTDLDSTSLELLLKNTAFDTFARLCSVVFATELAAIKGEVSRMARAEAQANAEPGDGAAPTIPEDNTYQELEKLLKTF